MAEVVGNGFIKSDKYISKRKADSIKCENMNHFYDFMYKKYGIPFKRIDTRNEQMRGVDVIFGNGKNEKIVDEKTATDYWNRDLNTFSFELYAANNAGEQGWFRKDSFYKTTDYMLGWVRANEDNDNLRTITSLDCCLVNKETLMKAIANDTGLTTAEEMIEKLNSCEVSKFHKKTYIINNDYRIIQSLQLPEKPINIIVSKRKLKRLAGSDCFQLKEGKYKLTEDGDVVAK